MKASVGRIVHYRTEGDGPCLAAIVTAVHPTGNLNLAVFDEVGDVLQRHGIDEADPEVKGRPGGGGVWHWPERADG